MVPNAHGFHTEVIKFSAVSILVMRAGVEPNAFHLWNRTISSFRTGCDRLSSHPGSHPPVCEKKATKHIVIMFILRGIIQPVALTSDACIK